MLSIDHLVLTAMANTDNAVDDDAVDDVDDDAVDDVDDVDDDAVDDVDDDADDDDAVDDGVGAVEDDCNNFKINDVNAAMATAREYVTNHASAWDPLFAELHTPGSSVSNPRFDPLRECYAHISLMNKRLFFVHEGDEPAAFAVYRTDKAVKFLTDTSHISGVLTSAQFLEFISRVLHNIARGKRC